MALQMFSANLYVTTFPGSRSSRVTFEVNLTPRPI